MSDQPHTGNGFDENDATKKDVLLDARLKRFQADFVKTSPKVSAMDAIRSAFRKGKR